MNFEEKVTQETSIYKGKIIDVVLEDVTLPNGLPAKREIVHHQGAVAILPITAENKVILVRQWRSPMRSVALEIPAGKIEPEETDPLKTAYRELNEETRFDGQLTEITRFYSSPGFSDELLYLYHATNLRPVTVALPQDDDEFIELLELTLAEAKQAIAEHLICDAKTIMAIYYWELIEMGA